jgi:hypothetical protein
LTTAVQQSDCCDRSESFAKLANVTLIPSPAGYCEEVDQGPVSFNKILPHPEVPEAKPFRAYAIVTAVPPRIDEFITGTEAILKNQSGLSSFGLWKLRGEIYRTPYRQVETLRAPRERLRFLKFSLQQAALAVIQAFTNYVFSGFHFDFLLLEWR